MTYALSIGPWHVGPFTPHIAAQHWAESHGCDNYRMIELDDPAEAPLRVNSPTARAACLTGSLDGQTPSVLHIQG